MALRLRRGTDAERLTITPLQGELIYATDTKKLYVGDGATAGGILVGPVDADLYDLVNDTTPQLGGDLDLNGNNITGTGNINIDGTITATGNIGLGDADADQITVGGVINSSLRPALDTTYDLGSQSRKWQHLWTGAATIDQTLTVESIVLNNNIHNGNDSSIIYNADTDTLSATTIIGNVTGSVFSDDSGAVLVDSVNGQITGPVNNASIETGNIIVNGPLGGIDLTTEGTIDDDYSLFTIKSHHSQASASAMAFFRTRGTTAAQTAVIAGDPIFDFQFLAQSSSTPAASAIIGVTADPNGTIDDGIVPGKISLATFNDSGVGVVGLSLDRNGEITVADNTLSAGVNPGEVDDSAVANYLKITVGGTEYALPLYAIVATP